MNSPGRLPHPMSTRLRTVAVVLAGGTGSRVGLDIPKQLIKIAGKTDPRAHPRRVPGRTRGRRDRRADGRAATSTRCARSCRAAATARSATILEGGEHPQRDHAHRAARSARSATTTARCCSTTRCGRCWTTAIITECFEPRWAATTPSTSPSRPPTRSSRSTSDEDDHRHPRPRAAAARPDPAGVPALDDPRGLRAGLAGPRLHRHRRLHRRAALPPRRADLGGRRRRAEHEGHRPDRRLPRRQAVPARPADAARRPTPRRYQAALAGKTWSCFGGSYGIGADIAELADRLRRAPSHTFSRSSTGTHVERARGRRGRAAARRSRRAGRIDYVVDTAGRAAAAAPLVETRSRRRSTPPPRSTTWRRSSSPRSLCPTCSETKGQLLLFTSSSYTRGRGGYSLYSSAKAAVVNLTQALADEWAAARRAGQLRQPRAHRRRRCAPRRSARSRRARCSSSKAVALTSIDVLLSDLTGHVIDVRRVEPGDARHVPHRARGQPDRRGAGRGGVRPGRPRQRLSARWPERRGSC